MIRDRVRWLILRLQISRDCRRGDHVWRGSEDGVIRCKFCAAPIEWPTIDDEVAP